jgi:4-hydroxy-3-polyprenylbenzoate decarboxylase
LAEKRVFIAITGASGAVYAKRLIESVGEHYDRVYLAASEHSGSILREELGVVGLEDLIPAAQQSKFMLLDANDLSAPPSSGSHRCDGMVIVPCSMGTVGRIAAGVSNDLITRAADVCLKERRKLIIVAREMPYSLIHLENMTALTRAGATIFPACPSFYRKPETIDDLVDSVIDRVLDHLGLDARLVDGWRES